MFEVLYESNRKVAASLELAEARAARYAALLQRIFHWDHMDTAADGTYWKSEIAAALAEAEGVGEGGGLDS
jgi:hypothetical protein